MQHSLPEPANPYLRYALAIAAGTAFILLGDWLLGAHIEYFQGIATFTIPWVLDVFVVTFLSGMLVSRIVKSRKGKWIAFIPPFLARSLSYLYLYLFVFNDGKDFFFHLNLYYWGPTVILAVEFSNLGGILGDVLSGAYGPLRRQAAAQSEVARERA